MDKWFVYIVQCRDDSLYTGITTDVERRMQQHNEGTGAKYTRSRRPVTLVYWEEVLSHSDALKREYAIKHLSREDKLKIIKPPA